MELSLEIIGFGTVGIGFIEILNKKSEYLKERFDLVPKIVAISDKNKGTLIDEKGIDLKKLLKIIYNGGDLKDYGNGFFNFNEKDALYVIEEIFADIMVEMTYTNIETGEPATTHIKTAFNNNKHIITSNKGPIALYFKELNELAKRKGLLMGIEGTVLSGTPVFNLIEETLPPNEIKSIKGILNGTTNFILTKMETENMSYEEALKLAQKLGYAEADPKADVEGYDALAKVLILSNVVMGGNIKKTDIEREGITGISSEAIKQAKEQGYRYKLIGSIEKNNDSTVKAYVKPVKLPLSDPLSGVNGAVNALTFETDLLGKITIQGPGAGKIETGFSIMIDLVRIYKKIRGMK